MNEHGQNLIRGEKSKLLEIYPQFSSVYTLPSLWENYDQLSGAACIDRRIVGYLFTDKRLGHLQSVPRDTINYWFGAWKKSGGVFEPKIVRPSTHQRTYLFEPELTGFLSHIVFTHLHIKRYYDYYQVRPADDPTFLALDTIPGLLAQPSLLRRSNYTYAASTTPYYGELAQIQSQKEQLKGLNEDQTRIKLLEWHPTLKGIYYTPRLWTDQAESPEPCINALEVASVLVNTTRVNEEYKKTRQTVLKLLRSWQTLTHQPVSPKTFRKTHGAEVTWLTEEELTRFLRFILYNDQAWYSLGTYARYTIVSEADLFASCQD